MQFFKKLILEQLRKIVKIVKFKWLLILNGNSYGPNIFLKMFPIARAFRKIIYL